MARTWYGRRKLGVEIVRPSALDSLTASATTVAVNTPSQVQWGGSGWQQEVWEHYDTAPEQHRAQTDMGEAFSRAKLMVVDVNPTSGDLGENPTDDPVGGAIIRKMFGGRVGQAQAQRAMGQHLTGPGEFWVLVSDQVPDVDGDQWAILAVGEVTKAGNLIQIQNMDGTRRSLRDGELLIRVWQPHPARRWLADSPTLAELTVLREMAGFTAQIMASIRSRLASAGVWLLPQSATLPVEKDEAGQDLPGGAPQWMRLLATAMMTAISRPDDPSALVPIVAMIPDDVLAKIQNPIQFVQDLAADLQPLRDSATKRFAIGFDAPPERLLGVGDMNHWSAWQTDESFVKGPLSSLLSVPAAALTEHYLKPTLRLMGKDPELFAFAFDVSDMMPDVKAEHAEQARQDGVLSERAYLEALGFDPDRDAATPEERAERLVLQVLARGNPESLEELLPTIKRLFPGIQLTVPITTAGPTPAAPVAETPPAGTPVAAPSTTDTQTAPPRPSSPPDNTPTTPPAAGS